MHKKFLYAGYIVIVTVFFLYHLFPGDAVTAYINYKINSMSSDVALNIKTLTPSFPPGVKLSAPDLLHRSQPVLGADFLKIKPSYISLLGKNKTFHISGKMYTGDLDSIVRVSGITASPDYEIEASFAGVRISDIPVLKQFESYEISGTATGEMFFSNKEVNAGKGNALITITDSVLGFTPALFGIDEVTFKSVNADFEITGQRVELKKLEVDSRDVSGSAAGSIILRNPISKSTINIRGEVKPHPAFIKQLGSIFPVDMLSRQQSKTGSLPFRITGSIERPNFALR